MEEVRVKGYEMRICLLARYFDYKGTGVTRVSTMVLKELVKRGHSVYTVSTKGSSLYSYFYSTLIKAPIKIPRKDIDVYHALGPLEGMWLPRDKSIVTFLDLFTVTHPDRLGAGMESSKWKQFVGSKYFLYGSKLASRVKFITCISGTVKEDLASCLGIPKGKIKVIRLGINTDLRPQRKKDRVFRIGTLAQLDARKRINILIKSFKKSKIEGELVIAGRGIDEDSLRSLANGDERIRFLGRVPESDLIDFYNSLDVFVFPTWIEGYGLPIVEAMACKKPVVVLNDAIIPEEVKSRCIIVEDLDMVFGNRSYLEGLCGHVDYESNYKFAKEHNWERTVDEYVKLYKEVLNES